MEALSGASLIPLSVLCERRTGPRKLVSLPIVNSPLRFSNSSSLTTSTTTQDYLSKTIHGGVVLLSSILCSGTAKALTYEEALEQAGSIFQSDFDPNELLNNAISFGAENPTLVAGGAVFLAVSLFLSVLLNKGKPWGVESARRAYGILGDDANAQLLDIRPSVQSRKVGCPDIRGLGKKPVSVVYKGEDKPGFLKKLSSKFKNPEVTTLFILDKSDGNSELVAELVTANGFKAAYAIKDGAEGPRGWLNSGLPWVPPKSGLAFDLGDLADNISGVLGVDTDPLSVTFAIAAAAGLGLLAYSEVETILQVLGSAALVQFVGKKFLFAEDRKQTLKQLDEFLTTKVAPQEFVDEMKDIGKALLPVTVTSKALPAPPEASSEPAVANSAVQNAEAAPQINSVPAAELKPEPGSGFSGPLSPYPSYPDFKPPTSPTPSQP